ncbi:MauE/DoxX family redox-associated membrane protein [Sphingomonas profundi]|uniref:MauE/DoxX family redox-associated membrane protein n=1 Tax=Alterirhizorhabdus profundi TaxID=2681549 RepID=UPI001E2A67BD|nr:MauE/DoxX family redox-associated membrane protein [Sphingomonas profundi]
MSAALLIACVAAMARIGVACLFAAAAIGKLRRRDDFAAAVAAYRLLPDVLVAPVAAALPPVEIAIALGLVAGLPLACAAAAGLLALFAAAMAANLARGRRHIDCGCDPAAAPRPIGWRLVARNLTLGLLLAGGLAPLPALPLPLLATAAGAGLLVFLLGQILASLGSIASPRTGAGRAAPTSGVR